MTLTRATALLLAVFAFGCGDETIKDTGDEPETPEVDGAEVYAANCSGCHGANGEGAAGNPSLIEGVPLLNDEDLMNILVDPPPAMSFVTLETAEADAVFVYLREQFGEYGGAR